MAASLIRDYAIDAAPKYVAERIEKYTLIKTPQGEQWMVNYNREWHLLSID